MNKLSFIAKVLMSAPAATLEEPQTKKENHMLEYKGQKIEANRIEDIFEEHPNVVRCHLVQIGHCGIKMPAVVVETRSKVKDEKGFSAELLAIAKRFGETKEISTFFLYRKAMSFFGKRLNRLKMQAWANSNSPLPNFLY